MAARLLDDDVDFGSVLGPEVREFGGRVEPSRLSSQLLEHKGLQEVPKQFSVGLQRANIGTEQCSSYPGVDQMALRALNESLQATVVPCRQSLL